MKGLLPIFALVAALVMAEGAISQDPGRPDSLAFGLPDGTPVLVNLDIEAAVPVWLKCDENIAFINLSLATQDEYVAQRLGAIPLGPLAGWDMLITLPAGNWPQPGLTTQGMYGMADFRRPTPNYINTGYQWVMIGVFRLRTTANPAAMGRYSSLLPGEDPMQGLTVLFDDSWNPIVPAMRFCQLRFQSSHPPVIISPRADTAYSINGPFPIRIPFIAADQDSDAIALAVDCPFTGYTLTRVEQRAGYSHYDFNWTPGESLSAIYPVNFIATDPGRATDVNRVTFMVEPISLIVETDTVVPGFSSEIVVRLRVNGRNGSLGAFNLLFFWDPSVLTLQRVDFLDSIARWEYTTFTRNAAGPGSVRVLGIANLYSQGRPYLKGAEYRLFVMRFSTANEPGLAGTFVPFSMPVDSLTRNVVSDSSGYLVFHPLITAGGVYFLHTAAYQVGDINLNGNPYEVGDAVLLAQHLMNPATYTFNPIQLAASDCNGDGFPATIGDLLYMIGIINGTITPPPLVATRPGQADIQLAKEANSVALSVTGEGPIGGVLVRLAHPGVVVGNIKSPPGVQLYYNDTGDLLSVLVYSPDGVTPVPQPFVTFDVLQGNKDQVVINHFEASDLRGRLLRR